MKVSYWIIAILFTFVIAFATGYTTGQRLSLRPSDGLGLKNTSIAKEPSVNALPTLSSENSTATQSSLNLAQISPRTMETVLSEIDNLLVSLDENPNHRSSVMKLYVLLETLSEDELIALTPSFEDMSESQRNMLSDFIVALLIEKSPEKALDYAQRYSPKSGTPFYIEVIKAQIAGKKPELGFEYLNQMLGLAHEDIDLNKNAGLINVLAKADLKKLVRTLAKFQDLGVKLENSVSGIAFGLQTNEAHLDLFNELRQLNDMSILSSVLINWMKVSPNAVMERLNEIEDMDEREELINSAFRYWMYESPEAAADHHLANGPNKLKSLKEIMEQWPDKKASEGLLWLSSQKGIDINRHKIDYLNDLSYLEPEFVRSNLDDIHLSDNEKIAFYQRLYNGFKRKSSADAEQFLSTLPFKDEVLGTTTDKENSADTFVASIGKAFKRYFDFKHDKAFALATGDNGAYVFSYVVNMQSQEEANQLALSRCEQRRYKYNIANKCKVYAEGDTTLFSLTP